MIKSEHREVHREVLERFAKKEFYWVFLNGKYYRVDDNGNRTDFEIPQNELRELAIEFLKSKTDEILTQTCLIKNLALMERLNKDSIDSFYKFIDNNTEKETSEVYIKNGILGRHYTKDENVIIPRFYDFAHHYYTNKINFNLVEVCLSFIKFRDIICNKLSLYHLLNIVDYRLYRKLYNTQCPPKKVKHNRSSYKVFHPNVCPSIVLLDHVVSDQLEQIHGINIQEFRNINTKEEFRVLANKVWRIIRSELQHWVGNTTLCSLDNIPLTECVENPPKPTGMTTKMSIIDRLHNEVRTIEREHEEALSKKDTELNTLKTKYDQQLFEKNIEIAKLKEKIAELEKEIANLTNNADTKTKLYDKLCDQLFILNLENDKCSEKVKQFNEVLNKINVLFDTIIDIREIIK